MIQQLGIVTRSVGQCTLVMLAGELDIATAPDLRDALTNVWTDDRETLAVDLAEVSFMDSAGVGVLVSALNRARALGRYFLLLYPSSAVQRVLDVSGLTNLFSIVGTDLDEVQRVRYGGVLGPTRDPMTAVARSASIEGNRATLTWATHRRRQESII